MGAGRVTCVYQKSSGAVSVNWKQYQWLRNHDMKVMLGQIKPVKDLVDKPSRGYVACWDAFLLIKIPRLVRLCAHLLPACENTWNKPLIAEIARSTQMATTQGPQIIITLCFATNTLSLQLDWLYRTATQRSQIRTQCFAKNNNSQVSSHSQ
jgi:hypothetical protein